MCFASLTPGDPWSVGFLPSCVHGWYTTGGFVLMNTAFGDLTAILIIIEWIRPDKWIFRLLARRQPTQQQMNNFYTLDSDLYLPFRYQLILKWVFLTLMFCPAFPLLLPYGAVFCLASYCVDRYNLLRVFKPPPRTTDRTISMSVLYILPLAVFAHIWAALFFYSKQAGVDVPLPYFGVLGALAVYMMWRLVGNISKQALRPIKHTAEARDGVGDGGADGGYELESWTDLADHLDRIELYVPPLTATLLSSVYESKLTDAREQSQRSLRQAPPGD